MVIAHLALGGQVGKLVVKTFQILFSLFVIKKYFEIIKKVKKERKSYFANQRRSISAPRSSLFPDGCPFSCQRIAFNRVPVINSKLEYSPFSLSSFLFSCSLFYFLLKFNLRLLLFHAVYNFHIR